MNNIVVIAYLICISYSYTFDLSNQCQCQDYTDNASCVAKNCKWNNSQCSVIVCADYVTQETCDNSDMCAYSNSGICTAFLKCSDYSVAIPSQCSLKGSCLATDSVGSDGKFQCQDIPNSTPTYVTCSGFNQETQCQGKQTSDKLCQWKTGGTTPGCIALAKSRCSDADQFSAAVCGETCTWIEASKTCQGRVCSDNKTSSECKSIINYENNQGTLCYWDSSKCIDAVDMSALTASTCAELTWHTHFWSADNVGCMECTGASTIINLFIWVMLHLI